MIYNIKTNSSNYILEWESTLECFIALKETGGRALYLYEEVYLCADAYGHFDSGLNMGDAVRIVEFREDATDMWLGVCNEKDQFGWVKPERVKKISEKLGNLLE